MSAVLKLSKVSRSFGSKNQYEIIKKIDLEIKKGEVIALTGKSGSGKTTLLQIAGLLDKPTSGQIFIKDIECSRANDKQRTALRRDFLGFVYQFHYLLQEFSVLENIMLPQIIIGKDKKVARESALAILDSIGLANKRDAQVGLLSGGEKQRVAIARGLVNLPQLFLADEPTGNLDPETSMDIFSLIYYYAKQKNIAVFLVTHNNYLAEKADKIMSIENGIIHTVSA